MNAVPHDSEEEPKPEEKPVASRRTRAAAMAAAALKRTKAATAHAASASKSMWARAGTMRRDAAESKVAQRLAALADKTADQTKHATTMAVAASNSGLARAAEIGRDTVLPELRRTGAKLKERTRPERLKGDYHDRLIALHERVLDRSIERLFFVPTAPSVALEGLTIVGSHRAQGHDYRPIPYYVFEWAIASIDFDFTRLTFVDYGAGKGRALLLAAQHPFKAVGGIEFAEELHDAATMNIAQFPRSRMKCRDVECILEDAAGLGTLDGEAVHYFFNPFSREVFAQVLNSLVASYRQSPRRLYLVLVDPIATDLVEQSLVFKRVDLPPAVRIRAKLFSPYEIAVYRSLA